MRPRRSASGASTGRAGARNRIGARSALAACAGTSAAASESFTDVATEWHEPGLSESGSVAVKFVRATDFRHKRSRPARCATSLSRSEGPRGLGPGMNRNH